jgi:signal transduction histidine kinase
MPRTRAVLPVEGVRLQLWRAISIYRVVTVLVTVYLILRWQHLYRDAGVANAVAVAMVIVTGVMVWLGVTGRAHRVGLVIADAGVTALLTVGSIWGQTATQRHGTMPTLTTLWAAGPALEAGLVAGGLAGVAVGVVQVGAAMLVRDGYDGRTAGSGVLLVVAGGVAGYVAVTAVRAERELAAAVAARAASQERERLARTVHDGVLQVLGLVHRELEQDSGRWAELAAAAREQEARLRALIHSNSGHASTPGTNDLAEALRAMASGRVNVATPAEPVLLPSSVSTEMAAAVAAALDNATRHAGALASVWVLLEELPDTVVVTIRDDGVGIPAGRLEQAERSGRLGVVSSIRGRIADLGGTVVISSIPGAGTRVELTVPTRCGERG